MPLTMDTIRALKNDEVLALIMEEAAELIHAASKARRFGDLGSHPTYNNGELNFHGVIREAVELNNLCRSYCAANGENWGEWADRVAERARRQQETIGAEWVNR
jgi:hypothetical protein